MDQRLQILNILKRRPQAFGIPMGSVLPRLRPDDMVSLSKKTFAVYIGHENLPALARLFIGKLDAKGEGGGNKIG